MLIVEIDVGLRTLWEYMKLGYGIMKAGWTAVWNYMKKYAKAALAWIVDKAKWALSKIQHMIMELIDLHKSVRDVLPSWMNKKKFNDVGYGLRKINISLLQAENSMKKFSNSLINTSSGENDPFTIFTKSALELLEVTKKNLKGVEDIQKVGETQVASWIEKHTPKMINTPEDKAAKAAEVEAQRQAAKAAKEHSIALEHWEDLRNAAEGAGQAFGDAMYTLLRGTKSATEALGDLVQALTDAVVQALVIQPIVSGLTSALTPTQPTAASNVLASDSTAMAVDSSAQVAPVSTPTVINVSVASPDPGAFEKSSGQLKRAIAVAMS